MKIAIIGRSEVLYDSALHLHDMGHEIVLIITSKEAPEYTKKAANFEALARQWSIPFFHAPKISSSDEIFSTVSSVDIGVSFNYTGVIPQSVIDLFPLGILNAHGGDLPRYRGNACQAWAILNGEDRIGLCVHRMIGGELDSGDILARDYFPLDINTKITSVWEWMGRRVPTLFSESLALLKENPRFTLVEQSKAADDALRCYPRKPEDGRINWSSSATDILRLINASNKPYSGAFCFFEGKKLIIWDAEIARQENFLAIPGQITLIRKSFVEVATGAGKLHVNLVESPQGLATPDTIVRTLRQRFD